jgi:hypothetical protein
MNVLSVFYSLTEIYATLIRATTADKLQQRTNEQEEDVGRSFAKFSLLYAKAQSHQKSQTNY